MGYLETIKYDMKKEKYTENETPFLYEGEEVNVITIFRDINIAIIEDKDGNIFEVQANLLR